MVLTLSGMASGLMGVLLQVLWCWPNFHSWVCPLLPGQVQNFEGLCNKVPKQGWHLKKTGLKKTGFYSWFLLVFFKWILKKTGFYWFFSKILKIVLKNDKKMVENRWKFLKSRICKIKYCRFSIMYWITKTSIFSKVMESNQPWTAKTESLKQP